jgi:formate hydrogenlyase subunit 3/multisubunit Na+/H+ antiporter MnhD subunit
LYAHGTTNIHELSGKKHPPLVAVLFFIGALAMGGLPPLNGFFSKFAIFTAAAQAHLWWAFATALFTSFATMACLVKAGYEIFLSPEPAALSAPAFGSTAVAVAGRSGTKGCPGAMAVAMVTVALLVLASGFSGGVLNRLIDMSAKALLIR